MEKPINVNEGIWELCKYQHAQIKQYKEFIERTILVKILENYTPVEDCVENPRTLSWLDRECRVLHVKIPETRFMMLQTPNVRRQWEMLNWDTPVVKPEVYLNLMYKAAEEQRKNVETN